MYGKPLRDVEVESHFEIIIGSDLNTQSTVNQLVKTSILCSGSYKGVSNVRRQKLFSPLVRQHLERVVVLVPSLQGYQISGQNQKNIYENYLH